MKNFLPILTLLALVLYGTSAYAQPVVDGDLTDADYQTLAVFDQANNGFGTANNIASIRFYSDATNMYFGIPLDLISNDNLILFLDFPGYGGTAKGQAVGQFGAGGVFGSDGLRDDFGDGGMTVDFEVDYAFAYNEGGTADDFFVDAARYGGSGLFQSAYLGSVLGKSADQSGNPQLIPSGGGTFVDQNGTELAYDNSGSFNGRGLEHRIEISALPGVTAADIEDMKIFAIIVAASGFASNEFLPLRGYDFGNPGSNAKFHTLQINGSDPDLFVSPGDMVVPPPPPPNTGIFAPEGLNMPGAYDGFANPPNISAFRSANKGGGLGLITEGTRRYQTEFNTTAAGDVAPGTYAWLFTSGSDDNLFGNKWAGTNVVMNTLQTYNFNFGPDNQVTFAPNKYYLMNWRDNGYNNTSAIFMETSAPPADIDLVASNYFSGQDLKVVVELSAPPSPEEKVVIRYTTDGFSSSQFVQMSCSGTQCTGYIPAADVADTPDHLYNVLTTTADPLALSAPTADLYTLRLNNNSGENYLMGQVVPVPTMSQWALLLFALLVMNLGVVFLYNKRHTFAEQ